MDEQFKIELILENVDKALKEFKEYNKLVKKAQNLTNDLSESVKKYKDNFKDTGKLDELGDIFSTISQKQKIFSESQEDLSSSLSSYNTVLIENTNLASEAFSEFSINLEESDENLESFTENVSILLSEVDKSVSQIDILKSQVLFLGLDLEKLKLPFSLDFNQKIAPALAEIQREAEELGSSLENLKSSFSVFVILNTLSSQNSLSFFSELQNFAELTEEDINSLINKLKFFIEVLNRLSKELNNLESDFEGANQELFNFKNALDNINGFLDSFIEFIPKIEEFIKLLDLSYISQTMKDVIDSFNDLKSMLKLAVLIRVLNTLYDVFNEIFSDKMEKSINDIIEALVKLKEAIHDIDLSSLNSDLPETKNKLEGLSQVLESSKVLFQNLSSAVKDLSSVFKSSQEGYVNLSSAFDKGNGFESEKIKTIVDLFTSLSNLLGSSSENFSKFKTSGNDAIQSIYKGLEASIKSLNSLLGSLSTTVVNLSKQLDDFLKKSSKTSFNTSGNDRSSNSKSDNKRSLLSIESSGDQRSFSPASFSSESSEGISSFSSPSSDISPVALSSRSAAPSLGSGDDSSSGSNPINDGFEKSLKKIMPLLEDFQKSLEKIESSLNTLEDSIDQTGDSLSHSLGEEIEKIDPLLVSMNENLGSTQEILEELNSVIKETGESLNNSLGQELSKGEELIIKAGEAIEEASRKGDSFRETLEGVGEELKGSLGEGAEKTKDNLGDLNSSFQESNDLLSSSGNDFKEWGERTEESLNKAKEGASLLEEETHKLEGTFSNMKNALDMKGESAFSPEILQEGLSLLEEELGKTEDNLSQLALAYALAGSSSQDFREVVTALAEILNLLEDSSLKTTEEVTLLASVLKNEANISTQEFAKALQIMNNETSIVGLSVKDLASVLLTSSSEFETLDKTAQGVGKTLKEIKKPNDELKKAYQELGVQSGQTAISSQGLEKTLKAIEGEANKSQKSIKSYFNEVEAGKVATSVAEKENKKLAKSLSDLEKSTKGAKKDFKDYINVFNDFNLASLGVNDSLTQISGSLGGDLLNNSRAFIGATLEIADSFGLVSEETKGIINSFGGMISNSLEYGNSLKSLNDTYKILEATQLNSIANFVKEKAVKIASQAATFALNAVTKTATVVQGAFNAVMNLNPAIAIATAVLALVAALGALVGWLWKGKSSNEEMNKSLEGSSKAYDKNTKSANLNAEAQKKLKGSTKEIASEFETLQKKAEGSVLAQKELEQMVNDIADAYPFLTAEMVKNHLEAGNGIEQLLEYGNSINSVGDSIDIAILKQEKAARGFIASIYDFLKITPAVEKLASLFGFEGFELFSRDKEREIEAQKERAKEVLSMNEEDFLEVLGGMEGGEKALQLYYEALYDNSEKSSLEFQNYIAALSEDNPSLAKAIIEREKETRKDLQIDINQLAKEELDLKKIDSKYEKEVEKYLRKKNQEIATVNATYKNEQEKAEQIKKINALYDENINNLIKKTSSSSNSSNQGEDENLKTARENFQKGIKDYKDTMQESVKSLEEEKKELQERINKAMEIEPDEEFKGTKIDGDDPWGINEILNIAGELFTTMGNLDKKKQELLDVDKEIDSLTVQSNLLQAKEDFLEEGGEFIAAVEETGDLSTEALNEMTQSIKEAGEGIEMTQTSSFKDSLKEEGEARVSQIQENSQETTEALTQTNESIKNVKEETDPFNGKDQSEADILAKTRQQASQIKQSGTMLAAETEKANEQQTKAIDDGKKKKDKAQDNDKNSRLGGLNSQAQATKDGSKKVTDATKEGNKKQLTAIEQAAEDKKAQLKKEQEELIKKTTEDSVQLASALASGANDVIGAMSKAAGENYLKELDALEAQINEKMAIYQEERAYEEEKLREEKREREYEERMQELDRSIATLESQFANETSVKKRAQLADQIEQENKKKAEERRRRQEELAEKERQRQEKIQMFEFEMEKYQLEVQRIERQNKMAEQEKKQKIAQIWIDTFTGIALAWAINGSNLATMWYPAVFTGIMSGVAGAQTSAISGQNVTTPTPPPPRPPKFKQGGVIGNHGEQGINAVIGDGVSEVILPLTSETFKMFGAGVLEALEESISRKDSLFADLQKNLGEFTSQGTQIQIAHMENNFAPSQVINVNQTNNIPIEVHGEEELGVKMEEMALKVVDEIKDNLKVGSNFEEALVQRSRGVMNALKDQGLL